MNEFLERTYYHNTVQDYLIALGIIVLGIIVVKIIKNIVFKTLERLSRKTETRFDDYVINSLERFGIPALYILVVFIGLNYLDFSEKVENVLQIGLTVAVTFLAIRLISSTILSVLESYIRRSSEGTGDEKIKQLGGIMLIINIVVWAMGLIFLFDNLGYDVTAVIAGLGVGGIAIALAAQNILGDLFNYFVIFFDRPFEIGDFIIVDDKLGVVENIGIKTTRVKSLSGEQLVFSNSDLTNSRIHNYKRMQRRRVLFRVGVTYETSFENVKKIPQVLKEVVERQENITFDRAHFASYGDSSLDYEVVYYVLSSDYNMYMDIQQQINFGIFEEFEKMGVVIAYPTRTLWFANPPVKDEERPYGIAPTNPELEKRGQKNREE